MESLPAARSAAGFTLALLAFWGTVKSVDARSDALDATLKGGECFMKGKYMEIGIHAVSEVQGCGSATRAHIAF